MKINHLFLIFSAIFITSCGGGGGGGSDSGPAPTPAATVSLSSDSSSVSINSSVTLTWSSSNASSCSASGDWSGSKATSGNESVVIQSAGNNSFGLSCSGSGGSGQASVSVTGEGFTGVVVDGYIRDATVYLDANASFIQDGDEQATTSDAAGTFTLGQVDANLVASNGIDVDSNNALENFSLFQKASGELDFRVVTPITSSAYYLEGTETINTILGLDTSIDINSTDPVANMNDSDAYKVLYEKGVQITTLIFSLQSALNDINALQETSETYFQEFTKTLEAQYELNSEVVDIETPAFIDAYVDAVLASKATSLGTTNTTNSKNALHSLIPVISVRNEVSLTTALSNFSTGKFITDFKDMAKGTASADLVSAYVNDINSLIAEDQNVDLNDLVVVIRLFDDSATVDEDNSVDIAILSNDTLSTHTYGFSIETSAPTNGQVLLNTDDTISYVPEANFNGSDAFIYTVLVDDRSGSANVNITINPVNDTPIINDLVGSMAISEGQTSVLTVSASDVEGDTLTYSLTGTDAALLSISSAGVITFNTAPVYATKSFYSITVNVSDETDSASQALIITITNPTEGAPVISGLATTISVQENLTSVVTVSASDPDGDLLTFSWDFDGDGTEDSTLPDPIFAYTLPGFYIPRLIVSDGINQSVADLSVVIRGCPGDGPKPGPYFWYDCKDLTIFHGTSGKLILDPVVSIGGSFAKSYQLMGKAGPMGLFGDPAAGEIRVTDAKGGQAPPDVFGAPAPPDAVKNTTATINTITVNSLESSCGRLFPTQYTVRIRLVDPGVRVQILKATVYVLHDCDPVF